MKILVAVDGSDFTRRMLAWLAAHDEMLGTRADYTFVTVVPALPPHVKRHFDRKLLDEYYQDTATAVLEPVAELARGHGWRFETASPVGRPAETIAKAATEGAYDLVVLGSHGHSAVGSLVLGSTAQRVLSSCGVPVLVVR